MAPAIAQSNVLKMFEFGRCQVSKASDEALGWMLEVNTSLEELDIHLDSSRDCHTGHGKGSGNKQHVIETIKIVGLLSRTNQEALVNMTRHDYTLETCRLLDADRDVSAQIDFYVSLNRNGRRKLLLLDDNDRTVVEWIDIFLCGAGNNLSTIYYYLSMKPGLCCLA